MKILTSSIKFAPASIAHRVGIHITVAALGARRPASAGGTYHSRLIYTGARTGRRPASLARQRPSAELCSPTRRKIVTMASGQEGQPSELGTSAAQAETKAKKEVEVKEDGGKPKLPPLSAAEFRAYNHLAEKMDYFVRDLYLPPGSHIPHPISLTAYTPSQSYCTHLKAAVPQEITDTCP